MSPSFSSAPSHAVDADRLYDNSTDPSKQSTTPADVGLLSPYSVYQPYNSDSPSNFTSPADLTSNDDFSEFTDFNNSDDPYFGVDFDAGENSTDADAAIIESISLPSTELPIEAYLPHPHSEAARSNETLTTSSYTMSPNHSASSHISHQGNDSYHPNRPTQPQYGQGLSPLISKSQGSHSLLPVASGLLSTTDFSENNHRSSEEASTAHMAHLGHSPRVTITNWGGQDQDELQADSDVPLLPREGHSLQVYQDTHGQGLPDYHMGDVTTLQPSNRGLAGSQALQELQDSEEPSGRTGVDPEARKGIPDKEIQSLKDREKKEQLRAKNLAVDEWRSQGGDSSDTDDGHEDSNLNVPSSSMRQRASSTGTVPGSGFIDPHMIAPRTSTKDPDEGLGIEPVSDNDSTHENQLKEGQAYFNTTASGINAGDINLAQQSRHWSDAPMYPYALTTQSQAPSSEEAVRRWNERADNYSMISRTATWGTRRRSEPSIADIESINNGSFLKRLAITTDKEKRPSPSFLRDSFEQISSLVRKRSDGSKLKRNRSERDHSNRGRLDAPRKESQPSLTIPTARSPSSDSRKPASPRLDTNLGAAFAQVSNHSRHGSLSATSPKNPLNSIIGSIRRSRSKSDMSGLAKHWAGLGGPPVSTLAQQANLSDPVPESDPIKLENSDMDAEDEDDEDLADDGEKMDFDQSAFPIIPNFAGFQEHVKRLNPHIESTYLVDRIAHQQVVRYKALLGWRIKHQGAIANGNCNSGVQCIARGGTATLFDSNGLPRELSLSDGGLHLDISDGDSNPEGSLVPESFPAGVPLPPASTLPAEFECQLCFRVKKFLKPSDWTKHVHEDVQPFTCTYTTCREPKSFKRKADWVRHENERHRHLEWWTCEVDDCSHKCFRKDNFLQHLVREHKLPEPKAKTKAAVKKARGGPDDQVWTMVRTCHHETTNKPQDEPCKFCGKVLTSWKKLTVHLAKHMEHISLPVLDLVDKQPIDANTVISPVEPLPARSIPLPMDPTNLEHKHNPNSTAHFGNMNLGISPGGYSAGPFSSYDQTSPNVHNMPQFQTGIFHRDMAYDQNAVNRGLPFTSAPQSHHGMMYDSTGVGFTTYDTMGANSNLNPQSRGFGSMNHSPHIDQAHDFNPTNQNLSPAHTQGYYSHSSSHHSVSPDPGFVSGTQQMPAFQGQTMGPAAPFTSGSHAMPNYDPRQTEMIGMGDENFNFQPMNNNQDYSQMRMNLDPGNQGGPAYPPSTQGGYGYGHQL